MKLLLALILLILLNAFAFEDMLQQFVDGYKAGDVSMLPLSDNAKTRSGYNARDIYGDLFHSSFERAIQFRNVRWNDERITADYYANVDGEKSSGSMIMFVRDRKITKINHDWKVQEESEISVADIGQAGDKVSTAIAIGTGLAQEANPLLAGFGPAGFLILGAGVISGRNAALKSENVSMEQCISSSRFIGTIGWGATGSNLLAMAGAGPVGLLGGLVAGAIASQQNYKGDCVSGPVRFEKIGEDV